MLFDIGYHSGLSLEKLTVSFLEEAFPGLESLLILYSLELSLLNITCTTVVETVIQRVVFDFGFGLFLILVVFKGVIVPTFNNHLTEQNKLNRIESLICL